MSAEPTEFERERRRMVERQIAARDVHDPRVLDAMRRVPRHRFVPPERRDQAYADHPVLIGCDQTVSQPYIVAIMTQLLALTPTDRVLEIGTGSGYQTAILAELAEDVVTVERHETLADSAQQRLEELGYDNVSVIAGDGTLGCPDRAPFDAILVTAAAPRVPTALCDQLTVGGRLVCPTGSRDLQTLRTLVRTPEGLEETSSIRCVFVPLIGKDGWPG